MVMSDRIALLRMGELEQVASPREIYNRPATAYTAQFIGHTNLLQRRSEGRSGALPFALLANRLARWPWPVLAASGKYSPGGRRRRERRRCAFAARFCARHFTEPPNCCRSNAPTDLLLSVRTASRENWNGDVDLEFSPADAVPVDREISRRQSESADVLPRLSSRDHRAAAAVGGRVPARSLRSAFLLQLLVGFAVAGDRSLLDAGQLPPTLAGECLSGKPCFAPCGSRRG